MPKNAVAIRTADQLRAVIRESGWSANELAKFTGVPQPTITRFLNGGDMMLSTAEKLSAFLAEKPKPTPEMRDNIAQQLRDAIADSGLSAKELSKVSGVEQTTLSRFIRGRDMGVNRAAKVAAYLGMRLTKRSSQKQ